MKTDATKSYFLAKRVGDTGRLYWSRTKAGLGQWTTRRGIAVHYAGGESLDALIDRWPKFFAEEIPENAASKWKARK